jgi:hypothetical protein
MGIESECKGCGIRLRVEDRYAGLQAKCPQCSMIYTVPTASVEQLPPSHDSSDVAESLATPGSSGTLPSESADSFKPLPTIIEPLDSRSNAADSRSDGAENGTGEVDDQFYVRIPNGQVFGPTDAATIQEWAAQGRVNQSCSIRPASTEAWIGFSAWLTQHSRVQSSNNVPFGDPRTTAGPNIYGTDFGHVSPPANQSPTVKSGKGLLVLCLGLVSWVLCPTLCFPPICAIVTIVLGLGELKKIREGQSPLQEKTMVLIGLWAAVLNLVVMFGLFLVSVVGEALSR